ncbi:hypothetical protein TRFO_21383 [Tritrichomonas foetus]|uniref:Uncharacterized protein n=1 Tax=Tritrichomonas foetus TaxID=1144522 RepID=A0A1J4KE01_9EUKA|nr:hypothetical protein TRFO_21383 [Tritrichomonas foetus]|eukprot:OHT09663.1 hypothetical protein TRFO_21383 [Tritrichomonas foetus]
MNIISHIQTLRSITPQEIYETIFKSTYYPYYYVFHAIYICMNIRLTTNNLGLSWYRSIILNYCLSISPRYLLQVFLLTELPEFVELTSFKGFFIIWCLFNICPFDIVFFICNRPWFIYTIQILDQFTVAQCIFLTCKTAMMSFQQFPRIFIIAICCECSPILVDLFDRFMIMARSEPMAYEIHYSKRVIAAVLFTVFLGDVLEMQLVLPLVFVLLSIIDLCWHKGEVFRTCDFILPNFWTKWVTFNPNSYNY